MANGKTELERIAVVESQLKELDKKVDRYHADISTDVKEIKTLISTQFISRREADEEHKDLLDKLKELNKEVQRANTWRWFTHTASAVAGAAITFLLLEYLRNI